MKRRLVCFSCYTSENFKIETYGKLDQWKKDERIRCIRLPRNKNDHLDKTIKKLHLEKSYCCVYDKINSYIAEIIYKVKIVLILLYCNNVFLHMAQSE